MATTASFTNVPARVAGSNSVFRRVMDRMVSAREKQVSRYVNGYLLTLDDQTLTEHGYNRKALEKAGSSIYPF
uniref:hypothetical protein n=1 Tax=Pararhizobium sp. IMCC3301 TaxID=3067904 RepID=UPI0027403B92|nr:hypothetical protein [Pararhizobium sp. IMCC3301]